MGGRMDSVRKYVIDEVARWWTQAPLESRYLLLRRVREEKPKALTQEELQLAIIAAETHSGELQN